VLGNVINERRVDPARSAILIGSGAYNSEVHTVVTLYGQADSEPLQVGPHGYGAPDCSGGPRLLPGEKVMLFLYPTREVYLRTRDGSPADSGRWQAGQGGNPILFDGPTAYYLSWARYSSQGDGVDKDQRTLVGGSTEVLEMALQFFGASAEDRARAFQFVLGTDPPAKAGIPPVTPPIVGDAGLVGVR